MYATNFLLSPLPVAAGRVVLRRSLILTAALVAALCAVPGDSRGNVVTDWNAIALEAPPPSVTGPAHARILGYVHAAMFEAVNAIERRYSVYAVDVKAPAEASSEAAAATAAHGVLSRFYPAQQASLDAAMATSLKAIPDEQGRAGGVAVGRDVAERLYAISLEDGSTASVTYTFGTDPWSWRPTAPGMTARLAQWGSMKPFLLKDVTQFAPPGPLPVQSAEYARDIKEVQAMGGADSTERSARETATAIFWTISTPVPFNTVARAAATAKGLDLAETARLFALLNMAASDSQIVTWASKYKHNLLRPVTAIREAPALGNVAIRHDPNWEPLIVTPAHPDYPSGHCAYTGAAVAVLKAFFGDDATLGKASVTYPPLGVTRSWQTFTAMGKEVGDARVWGGIHTRTADDHADRLGREVAEYALNNFLRPAR